MDREDVPGAVYGLIDELLAVMQAAPVRGARGGVKPAPLLAAAEVLTMVTVGEFPDVDHESAISHDFRRHHPKVLRHTIAVCRCLERGGWPRSFADLLAFHAQTLHIALTADSR